MRVGFLSSYRDIQRAIESTPKADEPGAGFEATLASISPDRSEAPKNKEVSAEMKTLSVPPQEEFRASYRPSLLEVKPPEIDPLPVAPTPLEDVKPKEISVKTPTLLSATRLTPEDPFKQLTKDEKVNTVRQLVESAGKKHGIDPALSLAVVSNESSFNAVAISRDGHFSKGLMQLLDDTGMRQLSRNGRSDEYAPFNPAQNIDLGVGYLRHLHDLFSQDSELPNQSRTKAAANSASLEKLAVAAYNAGEGRVAAAQLRAERAGNDPGVYEQIEPYLPDSTQEYVQRVMASRASFEPQTLG